MLDAVIAVITKGEKVLLIQRAPGIRGGGYWAPVSGEVEPGESQEAQDGVTSAFSFLEQIYERIMRSLKVREIGGVAISRESNILGLCTT